MWWELCFTEHLLHPSTGGAAVDREPRFLPSSGGTEATEWRPGVQSAVTAILSFSHFTSPPTASDPQPKYPGSRPSSWELTAHGSRHNELQGQGALVALSFHGDELTSTPRARACEVALRHPTHPQAQAGGLRTLKKKKSKETIVHILVCVLPNRTSLVLYFLDRRIYR